MTCIPSVPLDGIVRFNKLANKKGDLLFRLTSVVHACLQLIRALATQSVRAVVRLVTGHPMQAAREVIGMLVQIVALPILGLGRTFLPQQYANKFEHKFIGSHRVMNLTGEKPSHLDCQNRVAMRMYGVLTFPVHLVIKTTKIATHLLTLDAKKLNVKLLENITSNIAALVHSLASATLILKSPDFDLTCRVFDSPMAYSFG